MGRATDALTSWGIVIPRARHGWTELTSRQRLGVVVRGSAQAGLLVVAARDLRRRPRAQVRGSKWLWAPVIAANYLGIGPIIYLVGGRRHQAEGRREDRYRFA